MTQASMQSNGKHVGTITLVGAGPGDPDLLTLGGQRALAAANLVIYDRLVNRALLEHAAKAEHLYIGKETGEAHHITQQRINRTMVEAALDGRHVVRLKGGDPYMFGRGGEEALAAREHGIPFRVVPGVTAGIAAAASAGIPLTHRDIASSVAFVTGCSATGKVAARIDWRALARGVETIVIYMGAAQIAQIAAELLAGNRGADEPVAVIRNGTLPEEEIALTTLGELAAGNGPRLAPPSIVVIGQVVKLRDALTDVVAGAVATGQPGG